ncbi:uncharacterized protein LTHEOB_1554 [Lasiodiplodia theobromae]|uniref:Steroid 5-alpha reductase C-terminal domain-containing protein n=1 Tax=Lasiodiplodia theobromae TaxID=45133 RepID=A0A5N5DN92_9PEZI|nr:uncharacterized protein LTHEOB_1554 [Lasiodiplodia theobromae]KAB2579207.1 hypothetical protein DBV05_g2154 [Lasiodiplodia theobromae]KAF4537363.1 hypothetical protein LTHEOB_1554 [Lasiodiplodia theobromae]
MAEQDRYGSHWGANPNNPVKDSSSVNLQNIPAPQGSGAEQDRYGGWFAGKAPSVDQIQDKLPKASGAEQDRFGGWFGGKAPSADDLKDKVQEALPKTSGAEQDRYGGWFGRKAPSADEIKEKAQQVLPHTSGAEQDRYGGWFGGKGPSVDDISKHLPHTSGAEQDRYAGWFAGKGPSASDISEKLPHTSGAEQDRYAGWFGGKGPSASDISERLPHTSGAEQDRYEGWFGGKPIPVDKINERLPHTSGAEQDRYGSHFGGHPFPNRTDRIGSAAEQDRYASHFGLHPDNPIQTARTTPTPSSSGLSASRGINSGAEQDRLASHFAAPPSNPINATAVGLLQRAILPSFGLHAGLSAVTYGVARYTNRVELKDWLWPSGMVANAWWSAVGTRVVYDGLSLSEAWSAITYPEKVMLTQVSAWGIRLFYRIASRSVKRGKDDPRYVTAKEDRSFWNKSFISMFLPEAVFQTLITLPFTLPFRARLESVRSLPLPENASFFHSLAVLLFTTGYALEVLADTQLESHKQQKSEELNREGVWSIVRHPNYLGDALVHFSFPVLLYGAGILHPLSVLGPVVNYVFLRFVDGDKGNEADQEARYPKENQLKYQQLMEYKREKNSFWPSPSEVQNKWTWIVLAAGAGGVILERGVHAFLRG